MSSAASCLTVNSNDPAVLIVAAACALLILLLLVTSKHRRVSGNRWFALACLSMIWWLGLTAIEISAPGRDCKMIWAQLAWPGIAVMPTAWAFFLYQYALAKRVPTPVRIVGVGLAPVAISLLAFTNEWHHLFYLDSSQLVETAERDYVDYHHGPMFYAALAYLYFMIVSASVIVAAAASRASQAVRGFFIKLLLITMLPVAGNLAYVLAGITLSGLDPTPFLFCVSLTAVTWLIADNRWIDVNAIGRHVLYANSRDAILIVGRDGWLNDANPEAMRLFAHVGLRPGSSARQVPAIAQMLDALKEDNDALLPVIRMGERSFAPRAYQMDLIPGADRLGWVLALIDVSVQEDAAEAMREAARRAQAADAAKSQFLANVSHELRTPLTVISGSLKLMRRGAVPMPSEKADRMLKMADTNADALTALVNDLLDVQRIDADRLPMRLVPLDLVEVTRDAVAAMETYMPHKRARLELSVSGSCIQVRGDRQRLRQVLANVLSNAIKFSRDGGLVQVSVDTVGREARIRVTDSGMGIPEGAREKVFGRFAQVDNSDTRSLGGSGLGLHITRKILEAHDGQIDYESEVGKGTTFIVTLPLMDETVTPGEAEKAGA